jgi:hypothetical protein
MVWGEPGPPFLRDPDRASPGLGLPRHGHHFSEALGLGFSVIVTLFLTQSVVVVIWRKRYMIFFLLACFVCLKWTQERIVRCSDYFLWSSEHTFACKVHKTRQ